MAALLGINNVRVVFGGVTAVAGVSFEVAQGTRMGLIGPNGSGKSTLLAGASRLIDLTEGELYLDGQSYTRVPKYMASAFGISRTFQTVRLLQAMPVIANVMVGASVASVRQSPVSNWLLLGRRFAHERAAQAAAEAALERVGLAAHRNSRPRELPYGFQRKVEIARALASDPRILLLDEPTAGMNHFEREEVGDLLLELNASGLTIVLVEHDLAMIHRVCERVVALDFGRLIASGTPAEVARDPQVQEAYLGHGRVRNTLRDESPA